MTFCWVTKQRIVTQHSDEMFNALDALDIRIVATKEDVEITGSIPIEPKSTLSSVNVNPTGQTSA